MSEMVERVARARTAELFPETVLPRRKPRVLMFVIDAGDVADGQIVQFFCRRCRHQTEWLTGLTVTEAKRGLPCPNCNPAALANP